MLRQFSPTVAELWSGFLLEVQCAWLRLVIEFFFAQSVSVVFQNLAATLNERECVRLQRDGSAVTKKAWLALSQWYGTCSCFVLRRKICTKNIYYLPYCLFYLSKGHYSISLRNVWLTVQYRTIPMVSESANVPMLILIVYIYRCLGFLGVSPKKDCVLGRCVYFLNSVWCIPQRIHVSLFSPFFQGPSQVVPQYQKKKFQRYFHDIGLWSQPKYSNISITSKPKASTQMPMILFI